MIIGYARVSTVEQSLDRQIDQLTEAGCKRIYQEKASGASKERPELDRMLDALREGDVVVVTELSRLGRTVKGLIELVEKLHKLDVDLKSLKEQWLDTTSPRGKMVFTMMAGFAEMERDLIRERTAEGLKAARARGRKGGRPAIDQGQLSFALRMYDSKSCTVAEITKATGISKATLYSYLGKRENNEAKENR
ncbi:MAG: recombinase family protein [Alphaproteobacteria bacterium]|nr:recombinase family protein [Alphaproteobacteria bacterium]